jgi:TonB family protein
VLLPGLGEINPSFTPPFLEVDILEVKEVVIPEQMKNTDVSRTNSPKSENSENDVPVGDSPLFPAPPVNLPSRLETFDIDPPSSALVLPGAMVPDIIGSGSSITGLPIGKSDQFDRTGLQPAGTPPALDWKPEDRAAGVNAEVDTHDFPIEGPAAKRRVIYRPPLPRPVATVSGTISLRFWVRPDGTIGKIIPVVRGEPELEKTAIEFLSKWRFETLQNSTEDQWGILPIHFKLD